MTLKDRIKELCKENGVSVSRLESDCGFGSGYVSKLGKSTPNSQKLQKIADYFGVSLDYLMAGEPNRAADGSACLHFVLEKDADYEMIDFCLIHDIHVVNLSSCYIKDYGVQMLRSKGIHVYIAIADYISDMRDYHVLGADGAVTNWLYEDDWKYVVE